MASYVIRDPTKENLARFRDDPSNFYGISPKDVIGASNSAVILRTDGHALAVMGLNVPWPGYGQAWAFFNEGIRIQDIRPLRSGIHYLTHNLMDFHGLRRVTTVVKVTEPGHRKWAEFIGFKPEFVMEKAAPDGADLMGYVYWRD